MTETLSFWDRVKSAASSGVLLGIKLGAAVLVVGGIVMLLLGDYAATRQRSIDAVAFINQYGAPLVQVKQQQQAAAQTPPPAEAAKSDSSEKSKK